MEPNGIYMQPEEAIDKVLRRPGIGKRLLGKWGDIYTLARNLDVANLTDLQRQALTAAFHLNFVVAEKPPTTINAPVDIYFLVQDLCLEPREVLVVLLLNRRNQFIDRQLVYQGSVSSSQVRIAEVFRPAIACNASAIVIAHNHPSGDPTPSPDDVGLTRALVQAGKLLDIDVLDHIIIGNQRWVSLKERGLGFS